MPHRETYNSSHAIIQFQFDFTEKEFTITYFGILDIVSTLGGLNGFVTLIIRIMTPIFILMFLVSLSKIIMEVYDKKYRHELISILLSLHKLNLSVDSLSVKSMKFVTTEPENIQDYFNDMDLQLIEDMAKELLKVRMKELEMRINVEIYTDVLQREATEFEHMIKK